MTPSRPSFLTDQPAVVLDGPTGTELERRGFSTHLPLWTATAPHDAPDLLLAIHRDYVRAGADIITACTFRTSTHTLAKAGRSHHAHALTSAAVTIARQAAGEVTRNVLVAGSIAPLEDCYCPARTPDDETLARVHHDHVDALVSSGVDLLLVETMPTRREAVIAAQAAVATGLPVVVSLIPGHASTTLEGESLDDAVRSLAQLPLAALAVNCCSVQRCADAIRTLAASGLPFGAYANAGEPDGTFGFNPEPLDVDLLARAARSWLDAGARLIGACCGTGPAHIARLRALVDDRCPQGPTP